MKKVLALSLLSLFLISYKARSQKDTVLFYLDSSMIPVQKDQAMYMEVAVRNDMAWPAVLIKIADNSLVMRGSYSDDKLEIGEGQFQYFINNKIVMKGYYHNGKQVGVWRRWDTDNLLTDSIYYNEAGTAVAETKYDYHLNHRVWHYSYENNETKEQFSRVYEVPDTLTSESHFKNKEGETVFYYPNGIVKMRSKVKGHQLPSFEYFDSSGKKMSENEYRKNVAKNSSLPEYPGGNSAFFSYIEQQLKHGEFTQSDWGARGSVTFTFYLDENGSATNVHVSGINSFSVARALELILGRMPHWDMKGKKGFGPITRSINFIP